MFTGIIQALGQIRGMVPQNGDLRMIVATGKLDLSDVQLGDSIAVSGVCLTVVELQRDAFAVDVSRETLDKTLLGHLRPGSPVNLEKALRLADRLGGPFGRWPCGWCRTYSRRERVGTFAGVCHCRAAESAALYCRQG